MSLLSCKDKDLQEYIKSTKWMVDELEIEGIEEKVTNSVVVTFGEYPSFSLKLDANKCGGTIEFLSKTQLKISPLACTKMCCDSKFSSLVAKNISGVKDYKYFDNKIYLESKGLKITLKPYAQQVNEINKGEFITVKKTICFGTCPVYKLNYF